MTDGLPSIYGLFCPDTGALRYVGKANKPAKRLATHIRESRRRKTPVACWVAKLASEGKTPVMRVLEAGCSDWEGAERRLIAHHREQGAALLNVADGGARPKCSRRTQSRNGLNYNREVRNRTPMGGYFRMMREFGYLLSRLRRDPAKAQSLRRVTAAVDAMRRFNRQQRERAGAQWMASHPW